MVTRVIEIATFAGVEYAIEVINERESLVVYRENTASQLPVPSLRDARGQHTVNRVLREAGRDTRSPNAPGGVQ